MAVLDAAPDAICELQAEWLHDAVVIAQRDLMAAAWAAQTLGLKLTPGEPIPEPVVAALGRAQAMLWAGQPLPDSATLIDEPVDMPPRRVESRGAGLAATLCP